MNTGRRRLFAELGAFPPPLNAMATAQYLSRADCARSLPMLSEYAPWLLADFFGCHDSQFLSEFALAWLLINAYTLITDDLLDRSDVRGSQHLLIASGLILQRGLTILYSVVPLTAALRSQVNECFGQLASAVAAEITTRVQTRERGPLHKIHTLALCAACIRAANDGCALSKEELAIMDRLANGLQEFDDLMDWYEDWCAGHLTNPLRTCFDHLITDNVNKSTEPTVFSKEELASALVLTGSFETSLRSVQRQFKSIIATSGRSQGSALVKYLRSVVNKLDFASRNAKEIRSNYIGQRKCVSIRLLRTFVRDTTAQKEVHRLLNRIQVQGN
ncbi:MAG: class 1 isoprenoid biosynthesis enzyme [Acidobacteriaceae bacterium]|nr:class 1 isoprenoid biosynthesis enzyme [Acidobacteriaceae bacterium]